VSDVTEESKQPEQQMGWGCALFIFGFGLIVFIVIMLATGKFSDIKDSFEQDDSDCNDSYIEEDYNFDGETDAEDFRIQTSGC
jgi:hypothetical protein